MASITVRYFASARAASGVAEEKYEAKTVAEVLAPPRAQPEQLVVVVPVRRAGIASGRDADAREALDLDGVGRVGQAIDGQAAVARHYGSRPDQRIDAAAAAASRSRPPTAKTAVISCLRLRVPMLDPRRW